ncbi:MAG: hypothetical protein ABIF12_02130 [bacterium]
MIFATLRLTMVLIFRFVGKIVYFCSKKRKNITLKNLHLCFSDKSVHEINQIAKDSFALLGHSFADFLLVRFYKKKYLQKHFKINNFENFTSALNLGKGVILSTAHFGSFELAAHFFALMNYKSLILYNPVKKYLWLEKIVKRNREFAGNILIPKQNSLLTVFKRLKRGGAVLFAADQNCYPPDGKLIPLFSNLVYTHTGFVNLSLKTGAPIVPGFIYIKNLFDYEIDVLSPLYPQDFLKFEDPEYEMSLAINRALELAVKRFPAQWMWQHRRFKGLIDYSVY